MENNKPLKIAFTASAKPEAKAAMARLIELYGNVPESDADVIVALGGDGLMLETLRRHMDDNKPVYGLNQGTIGFLMNDYSEQGLVERIRKANSTTIHPLKMQVLDIFGNTFDEYAINEVSLLRQTHQTARLDILVDGKERINEIICDGLILASPAGSTAYNLSAYGPILPIGSGLMALTPISVFRPRRWRGALLRDHSVVDIIIEDPDLRPVAVAADNQEFRNIIKVTISFDFSLSMHILFDYDRPHDERILTEQFSI